LEFSKKKPQEFVMRIFNRPLHFASFLLIGLGGVLLALNIFVDGSLNLALPLVFLMLGGIFYFLVFAARQRSPWVALLFVPGSLLLAFGVIFLLNVLTNDWNAWAYAWLLLVASIGVGMILASRQQPWPQIIPQIGWGLAIFGVTFFVVFGAVAGGLFIQIMAPILLIAGGLALRWGQVERLLPDDLARRLHLAAPAGAESPRAMVQEQLVEPLSAREIEVLRLVDQGLSNQQIALKLNVAPSTVKTHINNIYGKLGVQTRVQALNRSRELGLL
jgi:DNA-binding CsgD family transcriptional regulator